MTNKKMLKEKIEQSGVSITFLAEKCSVSRDYFYRKMNGEVEFKQSEIATLKEYLHLTQKERNDIFFARQVDWKSPRRELILWVVQFQSK